MERAHEDEVYSIAMNAVQMVNLYDYEIKKSLQNEVIADTSRFELPWLSSQNLWSYNMMTDMTCLSRPLIMRALTRDFGEKLYTCALNPVANLSEELDNNKDCGCVV